MRDVLKTSVEALIETNIAKNLVRWRCELNAASALSALLCSTECTRNQILLSHLLSDLVRLLNACLADALLIHSLARLLHLSRQTGGFGDCGFDWRPERARQQHRDRHVPRHGPGPRAKRRILKLHHPHGGQQHRPALL